MYKYLYYSPKVHTPSGNNIAKRTVVKHFILLVIQKLLPKYIFEYLWHRLEKRLIARCFAGLDHNIAHQKILICEATFHGRIPIIHKLFLESRHNFDRKIYTNIEDFYDLSKSYIVVKNKEAKEIKKPITYIKAEDFFKLSKWQKYKILKKNQDDLINALEDKNYNLIIREGMGPFLPPKLGKIYRLKYKIVLEESAQVKKIGDSIIQELGTKFYTLHYRCPDKNTKKIYFAQSGKNKHYKKLLSVDFLAERLPKIFSKGEKIYLFSNIWNNKNYFDALKKDYILFFYYDFPALKKLIDTNTPNTFLLFTIEKYIAKNAQDHFELHWDWHKEKKLAMLLQE